MKLSQFDDLVAIQKTLPAPRLKPNIFARIVRFSWNNAGLVIAFWLFFGCLGVFGVFKFGQVPNSIRLPFPASQSVPTLSEDFSSLASLQTISMSNADAEVLAAQRLDLTTALREHGDIYELVFAPGANDFYDDYGMLFRPLDEINARVAYALSLKPLFDAVAAAPNAQSMTTLVGEIAGAVQQGRASQGVTDLLNGAASAVQALANGEDKPLDWSRVAELYIPSNSTSLTILALPKPGQESAARSTTSKLLDVLRNSSQTKTQLVQAVVKQPNNVTARAENLRIAAATLIGIAFAGLLLAVFVGRIQLLLLIFTPMAVILAPLVAAFMLVGSVNWASYWPAIFSCVFCFLLLSVHVLLKFPEHGEGQYLQQSDAMLVAQNQGKNVVLLTITMAGPWMALAPTIYPALILPALLTTAFCLFAPLCVLTLLTACVRYWPSSLHWQAREWLQPAHRTLFETRYWQIVAPAFGALIVCACFVFVVTSRGGDVTAKSDAGVNIVARDRQDVETSIARLKSFSGAQAVRWIGMFVPNNAEEKRIALHALTEKFPRIAPVQSEAPSDLRDQIDSMQESLKRIAALAGKDKNLADAADQFRRSLALLSASDRDHPIVQLENRLFGGFNRLADRAAQLASLAPIDIDTLPPELQRLFGHGTGPFRIEVDAAVGTSNEYLAVSLDQAGFNVLHPAVMQLRVESQKLRKILQVTGLAIGLVLVTLTVTFGGFRHWSSLILIAAASIVIAIAVNILWHSEYNLPWLIGVLALLSCFGGILHVAMARHETDSASVIEVFMLPSIALAIAAAYYALDVEVVSNEAMPLMICIFMVALIVSLFHHHSSPTDVEVGEHL